MKKECCPAYGKMCDICKQEIISRRSAPTTQNTGSRIVIEVYTSSTRILIPMSGSTQSMLSTQVMNELSDVVCCLTRRKFLSRWTPAHRWICFLPSSPITYTQQTESLRVIASRQMSSPSKKPEKQQKVFGWICCLFWGFYTTVGKQYISTNELSDS